MMGQEFLQGLLRFRLRLLLQAFDLAVTFIKRLLHGLQTRVLHTVECGNEGDRACEGQLAWTPLRHERFQETFRGDDFQDFHKCF